MAEIVDVLFSTIAATCAGLLFYGGWLCLSYGRAKKEALAVVRNSPARADKRSNQELTPAG